MPIGWRKMAPRQIGAKSISRLTHNIRHPSNSTAISKGKFRANPAPERDGVRTAPESRFNYLNRSKIQILGDAAQNHLAPSAVTECHYCAWIGSPAKLTESLRSACRQVGGKHGIKVPATFRRLRIGENLHIEDTRILRKTKRDSLSYVSGRLNSWPVSIDARF